MVNILPQPATVETPAESPKASKPKSPSFLSKLLAPLNRKGPKSPKKEKTENEVSDSALDFFSGAFHYKSAFVFNLIRPLGHSRWGDLW